MLETSNYKVHTCWLCRFFGIDTRMTGRLKTVENQMYSYAAQCTGPEVERNQACKISQS